MAVFKTGTPWLTTKNEQNRLPGRSTYPGLGLCGLAEAPHRLAQDRSGGWVVDEGWEWGGELPRGLES